MKPKKKFATTGRVILTSPVGIPREYNLPEDRIRALANGRAHWVKMKHEERMRIKRENRVTAARFTPEEEAEITERTREAIAEATRRLRKGRGFKAEDIRAEIEAEYV